MPFKDWRLNQKYFEELKRWDGQHEDRKRRKRISKEAGLTKTQKTRMRAFDDERKKYIDLDYT